jgi:hypothetical protein
LLNWTVTFRVDAGSVTVPVCWSTLPEELRAMLSTKEGNSKRILPDAGLPVMCKVTDRPEEEISMPSLFAFVVGKSDTDMSSPEANH